jgi:hypothetical protein
MRGANVWRMIRLFVLFFMMSHWIGCIWFLIAHEKSKADDIEDADFGDKYVYALFNGLLLLVAESIPAHENYEMIFIIMCFVFGQALSATIFGSMASLIKNLDFGNSMYREKMDLINEHMRHYNISPVLKKDIRQYYEYIWTRHRDLNYGKKHYDQLAKNLEESL